MMRGSTWAVSRGCSTNSNGCTNYIWGALGFGQYNYCCWANYCNSSQRTINLAHKPIFLTTLTSLILTMILVSWSHGG